LGKKFCRGFFQKHFSRTPHFFSGNGGGGSDLEFHCTVHGTYGGSGVETGGEKGLITFLCGFIGSGVKNLRA